MALEVGVMVFVVVVVGGLGSLGGAMLASLLIGVVTSLAVGVDRSLADLLAVVGARAWAEGVGGLLTLKVSSLAATIPFALMLLVLLVRPARPDGREGLTDARCTLAAASAPAWRCWPRCRRCCRRAC